MRTLATFLAAIVLTACGAEPGTDPGDPPGAKAKDHELKLPARHEAAGEVIVYAELQGATATHQTALHYALGDGYPDQVTLAPQHGFVVSQGCQIVLGAVVWQSIAEVQGTAAKVALGDGKLSVDLLDEGEVSVLLQGEITGQHCTSDGGPLVGSIPLQHRVVIQAHRVAGFVVEQLYQQLSGCPGAVVLPSGAPLWAPTASPLAAGGLRFEAANAPAPVAITLRSRGVLTPLDDGDLSAEAGTVSVSLDTKLPVEGLQSFEVVGPEALTAVEAALTLRKAAAKGSVSEPIEEGMSYDLFFPEEPNEVVVRVSAAETALGALCANVPGSWFSSASSTPEQCAASVGVTDPYSADVPVASVRAPGECRLEVTIPRTHHAWATRFTTTL